MHGRGEPRGHTAEAGDPEIYLRAWSSRRTLAELDFACSTSGHEMQRSHKHAVDLAIAAWLIGALPERR
jgi:hypothetical protein